MSWIVSETDQLDSRSADRLGNKFLLGNGYLGYRGTLEEHTRQHKTATIVAGLYDRVGDLWREPVNLPNGGYLQLVYQGRPLHAWAVPVAGHSQSLDLLTAVHQRSTVFSAEDGNRITLRARRFVSAVRPHLFCAQYEIQSVRDGELVVRTGIDGDVWDLNGPHLAEIDPAVSDGRISISAVAQERRIPVAVCESFSCPDRTPSFLPEEKRVLRRYLLPLEAGRTYTLTKFVALHTGLDTPDPRSAGLSLCAEAAQTGFDTLLEEHSAAWKARWEECDVQIPDDPQAQLALRFSLYHLLAVAPTGNAAVSIPARGLSGQVYKGAVFWDTEIFMLPFFAHAFPETARSLLMYRHRTLEGARRKAREYRSRGAFYAWESQDTGDDACTLYNITDVFTERPMRTYFRDKQIHISADIAYAIGAYHSLTGDDSLLLEGGAETVFECARFYLSRLYYHPERGRYELLDVTGPDEYHERVDNNAYTNWMAAHTFALCLRIASRLRWRHPAAFRAIMRETGFTKDLRTIRKIFRRLFQPMPDPSTLRIPQYDGYIQLDEVPLAELLRRKQNPREYLGGGNGLATQTQILKQADVLLGLCLFPERYDRRVLRANWEYYSARTQHGSSLSACSYAIAAALLGKTEEAYALFMETASLDLSGNPNQYVGPLYIGGTHPAASGGAWMAAVFGLCGIRWNGDYLSIEPHLPAQWNEIRVPLKVRGNPLRITLTRKEVTVSIRKPLRRKMRVRVNGKIHTLPREGALTLPCESAEGRP